MQICPILAWIKVGIVLTFDYGFQLYLLEEEKIELLLQL
jgi:hypothetical protein